MRARSEDKQTRAPRTNDSGISAMLLCSPPREWIEFVLKATILSFSSFLISCSDPFVAVDTKDIDADLAELLHDTLSKAKSLPNSGAIRGQLAMTYDVNGFPDAALATYKQAEKLDPGTFAWPYFQAMLLAKRNESENAIAAMQRAISLDPKYVPAWLLKGTWFIDLGRLGDAKNAYEEAARLGAGSPAIAGTARVLLLERHPAEAAKLLEPLSDAMQHPHLYRMLGTAYRALGRTDDARIAFARGRRDEALRWRDPIQSQKVDYIGGFGGRLIHAENALKAGAYDDALALLETLREIRPDDPALLSHLSLAYLRTGDPEKALRTILEGFELYPEYYYFHVNVAGLYREQRKIDDALRHLKRAIEINPNQAEGHEQLGRMLMQQGQYDEALASLETAINQGVNDPVAALHSSGLIEGARKNWTAAIHYFERAVEIDISFTMGHIYLGRCLAEVKRFDEARRALDWAEKLGTHPDEVASARMRLSVLDAA